MLVSPLCAVAEVGEEEMIDFYAFPVMERPLSSLPLVKALLLLQMCKCALVSEELGPGLIC